MEKFIKIAACSDCQTQWKGYCPLCKKESDVWVHENGKSLNSRPEKKLKSILMKITGYEAELKIENLSGAPYGIQQQKNKKSKPNMTSVHIEQPMPINHSNFHIATVGQFHPIEEIPDRFRMVYKSKGSEYYLSEDHLELIRKSDHWGYGISQCKWFLNGYDKIHCGRWHKLKIGTKIGIIRFEDLHPNKKAVALIPEYS